MFALIVTHPSIQLPYSIGKWCFRYRRTNYYVNAIDRAPSALCYTTSAHCRYLACVCWMPILQRVLEVWSKFSSCNMYCICIVGKKTFTSVFWPMMCGSCNFQSASVHGSWPRIRVRSSNCNLGCTVSPHPAVIDNDVITINKKMPLFHRDQSGTMGNFWPHYLQYRVMKLLQIINCKPHTLLLGNFFSYNIGVTIRIVYCISIYFFQS